VQIYDGLFEDGVHAVVFNDMDDLRAKILYYTANEAARQRIVRAAFKLVERVHTWQARATFITQVVQHHVLQHQAGAPYYIPPPRQKAAEPFVHCIDARTNSIRFEEVHARRPLRRYTVASCALKCSARSAAHFAMQCGGFCSGNGHRLARCYCAKGDVMRLRTSPKHRNPAECATTCSLHDSRPCGGFDSLAVYALGPRNGSSLTTEMHQVLVQQTKRPRGAAHAHAGLAKKRAAQRRGRAWNATEIHAAAAAGLGDTLF
jgi:hypothetical protein